MKLIKILSAALASALFAAVLAVGAYAYTFRDDRFIVGIDIPDGYLIYNCESSLDSSDDIQKKVRSRIADGMIIDALEPDGKTEITVYTASDALSQLIANYTVLDDSSRQSFSDEYKKGLSKNEHVFLCEPETVTVGEYDYLRVLARVGSSTGGYSYLSYVTVIGGSYYEASVYMPQTIPTEEEIAKSEKILKTFRIDVGGMTDSINETTLSQVTVTLVTVVCSLIMAFIALVALRRVWRRYAAVQREKKLSEMLKTQRNIRREDNK